MFGGFGEKHYICSNFLKPERMMINHWLRTLLCTAVFAVDIAVSAQTPLCKDTLEHRRLQSAMWESAKGHDADSVYEAIRAFQKHVDVEKDFEGHYSAWMCGVSYNLDRMNICDAYHIAVTLKDDLKDGMGGKEEQYMGPMLMGQVYNVCGNMSGCGIPENKVGSIFERFVKVDEFKQGLGLGLAYCRETAERLGGSLRLDHTSEAGTSFTLGLPLKIKSS